MNIGGTYASDPAILTGSYLVKRRISRMVPTVLKKQLLPESTAAKNIKTDILSMRTCGKEAIWPIEEALSPLSSWIDVTQIESTYASAIAGDIQSVRNLQSLQTLTYRLLKH